MSLCLKMRISPNSHQGTIVAVAMGFLKRAEEILYEKVDEDHH